MLFFGKEMDMINNQVNKFSRISSHVIKSSRSSGGVSV